MDAGPAGFQAGIGQYMSPYMQNVVDIEKREAARQAGLMGTQQQAQATQAGAFGGARNAIVQAERERNLAQQMGDIQSRGSQAAYEQAANQFRQGIQQQGAISQMQAALGAQQQQQAQRPLDVAYQDFLNQQNYPYKQLGFMSDLVRGMPLGQKSTSTLYEAPGSLLGQLGGLGMGAYGLSRMGFGFADGGSVTSAGNVDNILGKLSDQQLQQAREAALNRRDLEQVQMIDAEMAERSAARRGIAPALSEDFADSLEQGMATGGIVAFADRGQVVDKEKAQRESDKAAILQALEDMKSGVEKTGAAFMDVGTLPFRAIAGAGETAITRPLRALGIDVPYLPESYYGGDASSMTPYMDKLRREQAAASASQATVPSPNRPPAKGQGARSTPTFIAPDSAAPKPEPEKAALKPTPLGGIADAMPTRKEVKSAVAQLAEQNKLSPDVKDDVMDSTMKIMDELGKRNQPILDELRKSIEEQKPDTAAMKEKGLGQALAAFGFGMAQQASKRGREGYGGGLAGLIGSAAAASPVISEVAAKTDQLIQNRQDNFTKLKLDQAKYEVALAKGDMQTAAALAGQIRAGQQADKLLQFHIADSQDRMALERDKLAQSAAQQRQLMSRYETVGSLTRDIMANEGIPYDKALEKAARLLKPTGYAADVRAEVAQNANLDKALKELDAKQKYAVLPFMKPDSPKYASLKAEYETEKRAIYQRYGGGQGVAPPVSAPPSLASKGFKLLGTE